jgi:diguanylate cyclase (GGDEF)-like protein
MRGYTLKNSSETNQELIAKISVLKKRIQELEQRSSERIQEEDDRCARLLTVLHETSVELTAELNLDALLHSIAERALSLIGGAACNCYLYDPQTDQMERIVTAGTPLIPSPRTRQRGEGMVGQVWEKGTPLLINDYASWPGRTKAYDSFPSRALVAAPFRWGTEILGVLNIMAPLPHQYTEMDVEMLNLFATQAAIAIRNARIHDRLNMELAESKMLAGALKHSEKRYRELSIVDDLTQLYNSRHFHHQLNIELDRSNRYEQPLTLLMLDLDDFKTFNDDYGHVEGDQVLMRLGQVVKRCLRQTDSAYRYGGEEFTILLPMTTSADGTVTAERIRTEFKKETFSPAPGQEVHVTVSIGLAKCKPQEEMKAFVHRVDQLMYQGKKNGKDRVCRES